MDEEIDDGFSTSYSAGVGASYPKIKWESWKKKFAFLPTKLSYSRIIWLRTYYEREGRDIFMNYRQRGTLFEVLAADD